MNLKKVAHLVTPPARLVLGSMQTPHLPGRHPQFGYRNALDTLQRKNLEQATRGKIVLITGGSSGIGAATAIKVAAAGGEVVLVARRSDKLAAVAEVIDEAGGIAHTYACDLSDVHAAAELGEKVLADRGRVDVLVNNAGLSIRRSLDNSYDRIDGYQRTMDLNYLGAVQLILKFVPGMRERGSGQVLNVSTIGSQTKIPKFGAYIASKIALETLCDVLQAETTGENVRFSTVHMGLVRTPMIAPSRDYDTFPALSPEQAADILCHAIVHRPRRATTPIGRITAAGDAVLPAITEQIRTRLFVSPSR